MTEQLVELVDSVRGGDGARDEVPQATNGVHGEAAQRRQEGVVAPLQQLVSDAVFGELLEDLRLVGIENPSAEIAARVK